MNAASPGSGALPLALPAWFWQVAAQRSGQVAMRWQHLGIWNDIGWDAYAEAARALGCALLDSGARRGDRAAVLSDVRPEWCQTEFGALGVGVCTVGLHAADGSAQLVDVANDARPRWLFVQDQWQLEKALSVLEAMPSVEWLVYFDPSGLHALDHPRVRSFQAFLDSGRQFHARHPARWEEEVAAVGVDDVATIAYTAGTLGAPKGVLLTHRNLCCHLQALEALCPGKPGDEQLGFLSLAHLPQRQFSIYRALQHGAVLHLGKGLSTLLPNLREVRPHVVMAVPRVWEKLQATVVQGMAQATPMERRAYHWALAVGESVLDLRRAGRAVPAGLATRHAVARWLVLERVRTLLGLQRARTLVSVGAPIAPALVRWYQALGLSLHEAYGLTECGGIAAWTGSGPAPAGGLAPGTELRLAPDGEILVRGPHVGLAYLNDDQRGARTWVDGWLHTGDLGRFDSQGALHVTERRERAAAAPDTELPGPSEVEARLRRSPFIADAIVVAHGGGGLACLLVIEQEAVARHAREHQMALSGFAQLARAPEIRALLQQEIDQVNQALPQAWRLRGFALLDSQIGLLDPEMGPGLQLRRDLLMKKFDLLVQDLQAQLPR